MSELSRAGDGGGGRKWEDGGREIGEGGERGRKEREEREERRDGRRRGRVRSEGYT